MRETRSSNVLKLGLLSLLHWAIYLLFFDQVNMTLYCVSGIAACARPLRAASIPAITYDITRGLPTCLYYSYIRIIGFCVFKKLMDKWYGTCIYFGWITLSESESVSLLQRNSYNEKICNEQEMYICKIWALTVSGGPDPCSSLHLQMM